MKLALKKEGFSLTEVLLAVATLAISMTFVGGTFIVGIHLSTVSTERTIAAVVADEAFAKIRIYGVNQAALTDIPEEEFAYPSTKIPVDKQYYWTALLRPVPSDPSDKSNRLLQTTVFVSRKVGSGTTYLGGSTRPVIVRVQVSTVPGAGNENKLTINTPSEQAYINDGSKIVHHQTGQIYRVLQRDAVAQDLIVLDRPWQGGSADSVWVVPPPVGGGKSPCIAIYQKVIRF
jgi:hypothetical protein